MMVKSTYLILRLIITVEHDSGSMLLMGSKVYETYLKRRREWYKNNGYYDSITIIDDIGVEDLLNGLKNSMKD